MTASWFARAGGASPESLPSRGGMLTTPRHARAGLAPNPSPRGEGCSPRLALVRIEALLQAGPALDVVLLSRGVLGRELRHPLRKAGLEHEGHGAFELHRLQLDVRGVLEGL